MECTVEFPNLKVHHLTSAERQDLITKLKDDYNDIVQQFTNLVQATRRSLQSVEVSEFQSFLRIQLRKRSSKGKKTINDIFEVLHNEEYWTFFDFELLKAVIEHYCDKDMEHRLNEYLRKFGIYCERKLSETPKKKYRNKSGETYVLYVKLNKRFDGITLKEVKDIERRLQKEFHTCLYKLQHSEGCVLLVFESLHKIECFQFSKDQIFEDLKKFEILQLYSKDCMYYKSEIESTSDNYLEEEETLASSSDLEKDASESSCKEVIFACCYVQYQMA